jgi:hypothetical protein
MYKYLLIDFGNDTIDTFSSLDEVCDCIKTEFSSDFLINDSDCLRVIEINSDGYGIDTVELRLDNVELKTEFTLDPVEE